jgi:hypothetical protein
MQPIVAKVGPLTAGSATALSASQSIDGAQAAAMNGSLGTALTTNIAASQSATAGSTLTIVAGIAPITASTPGGALPNTTFLTNLMGSLVSIYSASDNSGVTFTIQGILSNNKLSIETINGPKAGGVSTFVNHYAAIIAITANAATVSTVTVGTSVAVKLDTARQIVITSAGDDSGITFTIVGRDLVGNVVKETLTGASTGAAVSALDYYVVEKVTSSAATASTVTIGTNGVARSPWISMDSWASGVITLGADVSGTANYSLQLTNDDPNSRTSPVLPGNMVWSGAGVTASTTSSYTDLSGVPAYVRTLLNSGSGSVTLTAIQSMVAPY